jgi:catechol 2,3-dioxygenase-like lactoylglutathione lyase family enzyme
MGLSHVPVAVRDLDEARRRCERLGFALKPGRPHDDGIRNLHIKFRDGTEVELITASEGRDELTSGYVDFLRSGDGPAYLALYTPSSPRLARALRAAGMSAREGDFGVGFPSSDALHHIFFGGLNQSPTDRPEHFAHPNGAESLVAVWLAADDREPYQRLFARVGVRPRGTIPVPPLGMTAQRVPLPAGEVLLLPGRARRVPARPIVGLTLRVRDLEVARRLLRGAGHDLPIVDLGARGRSLFLPPDLAGGFWLELREVRGGAAPVVR